MAALPALPYTCVACGAALFATDGTELACQSCPRSFPMVAGIPILTLRPPALLSFARSGLQAEARALQDLSRSANAVLAAEPDRFVFQQRAARAISGVRANLQLTMRYTQPLEAMWDKLPAPSRLLDVVSNWGAGWSSSEMLPYFYQDWGNTEDFATVREVIRGALLQSRASHRSVAVLGAGACGLLPVLGDEFDSVVGLDLSIATLLIAHGVLRGDRLVIHIDKADWNPVELYNPTPGAAHIQTAVGDVAALPFATGSMSAVVTQYLMDIVGNPRHVTAEIERVLEPDGIWVNFSSSFRMPTDPDGFGRFPLEELPEFLAPTRLRSVHSHLQPFKLLNVEQLSPKPTVYQLAVHFFVARKAACGPASTSTGQGAGVFAEPRSDWWLGVPTFERGRRARMISFAEVIDGALKRNWAVAFGLEGFRSFRTSRNHVRDLSRLFELVDGKRTAAEIFEQWNGRKTLVERVEFLELLHYLSDRHGLLSLRRP
jgi:SAM-dependent methyltransferase